MFQKTLFGQLFQKLNLLDDFTFQSAVLPSDEITTIRRGLEKEKSEKEEGHELIWTNIFFISLWHIVAVYSLSLIPHVSWKLVAWGFAAGFLGGFGVTGGAHRLWAHKSYKARTPFKIFALFCFTLAGQNSVFDWVRDHRVHHRYSDSEADPHNSRRGFFFSHVGWLMVRKSREVREKGKAVDMSDIIDDPILALHRRYFIPLKILIAFVLPSIIPPLVWGEPWSYSILGMCFIRYVITLNITWSVNSAAHIWGSKPYKSEMKPVQNKTVSFLSMGEGWHNYHHVFPWDYKAAELGPNSENLTTKIIDLAAKLGQVYDRKQPSKELIKEVARKYGDGTWEEYADPYSH